LAFDALHEEIKKASESSGIWMQHRIDEAKKALPGLLAQRGQPFKEAEKLDEMRARLADIRELDAKTKEAEAKKKDQPPPEATSATSGRTRPNRPSRSGANRTMS
jgi:hypothetical protein